MAKLLEASGVSAGYGPIKVLQGIDFGICTDSITAVIGSNGAGKTTLMRTLAGLVKAQGGTIAFGGSSLADLDASARLALGISLVPEGRLVFPEFTVAETLRVGAYAVRAREGMEERANAMYEMFPRLKERRRTPAGSLSGGEQQMLALARGLMSKPRLLLLDEPSLGLAPAMADEVFDSLLKVRASGVTIGIVEQNVYAALSIADYAYVMENGEIVRHGPSREIRDDPSIAASYLGC
ncbi:ABC transporter ATP-binding protein [Paraburkholderia ferrariae]|jgi:branched-chain amino acid transport system ATP-binding protein|uniref:ABC transporter ATP-binding protein n=1 Tax=Paraburkholderia ferrariae TaxID=386056 RepID=UPI000488DA9F|nr:ABC transporter ATP-binding protein [Paraburkholderia ferrariae]